jgi:hypothetical protein
MGEYSGGYVTGEETGLREVPRPAAAQDVPAPERRQQKRIVTIDVPGYDDFHVTAWVNFPTSLMDRMQREARAARRRGAERQALLADDPLADVDDDEGQSALAPLLKQIIVAHDWVDFDGQPYPSADDDEFYREVPTDLLNVAFQAIAAQVGKLDPKKQRR